MEATPFESANTTHAHEDPEIAPLPAYVHPGGNCVISRWTVSSFWEWLQLVFWGSIWVVTLGKEQPAMALSAFPDARWDLPDVFGLDKENEDG